MNSLKSYLLKQTTEVLTAALKQTHINSEYKKLLESILYQRQVRLNKYSHNKLLDITQNQLIELLNSPQIQSEDRIASKAIMLDILNILEEREPNADIYFSKEMIAYLRDAIKEDGRQALSLQ